MSSKSTLPIIGRTEKVFFPALQAGPIKAKVDTGADLSSLWATAIKLVDEGLTFVVFGKSSPNYTGKVVVVPKGHYAVTTVVSSFGEKQTRYVVKLQIKIANKLVLGTFTLANRSRSTYPILLGRKLISGKFLVDVSSSSSGKRPATSKISSNNSKEVRK